MRGEQSSGNPKRIRVPASHARGVLVSAGEIVLVRDVAGGQVGDLFAFCAADPTEHLSASHTRAGNRNLFPVEGQVFLTTLRRPILTLVEDTSPGVHDMLIAACDPARYAQLGASEDHRSCAGNLREAAAHLGFEPVIVPQPVNVFMNTPSLPDQSIEWRTSLSSPGDHIAFRAEMDAFVIVSSCPMDVIAISAGALTDLEMVITR